MRAARSLAPLFAKGFRPFFLLGAVFAVVIVPAWVLMLQGKVPQASYFDPVSWHAHEMIFGFVVAIVAGFLLTAVGNWTQRETAVGGALAALAVLWTAGRVALLVAKGLPSGLVAALDLAFVPALFVALGRPIVLARNRRNAIVLVIVAALGLANLAMHLDVLGVLPGARRPALLASVDFVALLMVLITGRVVPMFTRNATGDKAVRSLPKLDMAALVAVAAVAVADAIPAIPPVAMGALSSVAAVAVLARARHWGLGSALRVPLLWILHAGHAWIAVSFGLRAVASFTPAVPSSVATHAMTAGAVGALTLGMIARVSLGHSGRPIVAGRTMAVAFGLVSLAALIRVVGPLLGDQIYASALTASATAWAAAFLLFVVVNAPILVTPRADGKPG